MRSFVIEGVPMVSCRGWAMASEAFSNFGQAFLMGIAVVRELHFWITFGPILYRPEVHQ